MKVNFGITCLTFVNSLSSLRFKFVCRKLDGRRKNLEDIFVAICSVGEVL